MQTKRPTPTGLRIRHSRPCNSTSGHSCNCAPSVEAWAWDKRSGKKIRKTFAGTGAIAAAKSWRADASGAVRRGTMRAPSQVTLRQAAAQWLEGAKSGGIRNRSGDEFKPSTIYSYEHSLNLRILPVMGGAKLCDITRTDLQDFADRMLAEGLDASTIRNTLMPLRAILGRALKRGEIAVNPTTALDLPAVRGRRDRIVNPSEATELLEALPLEDRALWATALYAGLRRGELLALRWSDVDLAAGLIRVERSFDPRSGQTVAPKSHAGTRRVPILAALRDYLDKHKLHADDSTGLVFGRPGGRPFNHSSVLLRATAGWRAAAIEKARKAGASKDELDELAKQSFDALTLHEARHSFASIMIAAGVNAKALSTYMGHSSVTITYDRYGHLMPGSEEEAAQQADAYLARADTAARIGQLDA
jgi:integrase